MDKRTSSVQNIQMISIGFSSIFQIGDTVKSQHHSRAIALQVEDEDKLDQYDVDFEDYPLFSKKPNWPKKLAPPLSKKTMNHNPAIQVHHVDLNSISSSSMIHIGNLAMLQGDSRIKHFRLLKPNNHNL